MQHIEKLSNFWDIGKAHYNPIAISLRKQPLIKFSQGSSSDRLITYYISTLQMFTGIYGIAGKL